MSVTPEGYIARDALVRCEAMAAYAVSAREAVEAHDVARLGHAIHGMRLTLEDLAQYRDAALPEGMRIVRVLGDVEEHGPLIGDGVKEVGETVITPSPAALSFFFAATDSDRFRHLPPLDDDESDERGSEG
jgi:hypothetical protein